MCKTGAKRKKSGGGWVPETGSLAPVRVLTNWNVAIAREWFVRTRTKVRGSNFGFLPGSLEPGQTWGMYGGNRGGVRGSWKGTSL
jgi:hypothetical protein